MADNSKISWTDATWNFIVGCSHVSPGCENCYAESWALRWGWSKKPWKAQNAAENIVLKPERLSLPLRWKTPRRIFVNSMSDLFHELVPFELIDQAFAVMEACPRHCFQILTKRPERMHEYISGRYRARVQELGLGGWLDVSSEPTEPPANVWLGVSVEDQRRADERIPILLDTPAAVRFLSCEPLLDIVRLVYSSFMYEACANCCGSGSVPPYDASLDGMAPCYVCQGDGEVQRDLHWVIVGGESGPGYRPMQKWWAESLRDDCRTLKIPFFFKQDSGPRPGMREDLLGQVWHQFPDHAPQLEGAVA